MIWTTAFKQLLTGEGAQSKIKVLLLLFILEKENCEKAGEAFEEERQEEQRN